MSEIPVVAIEGRPVEGTHVNRLLVVELLPLELLTSDDGFLAIGCPLETGCLLL